MVRKWRINHNFEFFNLTLLFSTLISGKDAQFLIVLKDQLGEQRTVGGEVPTVNVIGKTIFERELSLLSRAPSRE